jgi:colanic acid/amylovoran biosynthesis glycosyltransferase
LKIGIVLSSTPAYSETFFRSKILFLKEAGYKVTLFVEHKNSSFDLCDVKAGFNFGNGMLKDGLSLTIAIGRLSLSPAKAFRLFKLNKKDNYLFKQNLRSLLRCAHILHSKVNWLHFGFATLALGRENLAKVIGSKTAASIRGYDIVVYPLKHPNCYTLLWQRLDKLHYISDSLLLLAEQNGFDKILTPAVKITPAIDTNKFAPKEKTFNNKLIITTIARLHWIKGLEYTLEALAMLKQADVDFEYHIIGEGEERERLVFAAYQFGIADNVQFRGEIPHTEIPSLLNETDIYIQYSINEGFGNSVLEAQAMGCLCIVSDAEGLSENVIHNETGFVVKRRQPELLYKAIQYAISLSENEKQKITIAAISRVKQEFNLERQKESFIHLYSG